MEQRGAISGILNCKLAGSGVSCIGRYVVIRGVVSVLPNGLPVGWDCTGGINGIGNEVVA